MKELSENVYVIDLTEEEGSEVGLTGEGARWRVDLFDDGRHWYFVMTPNSLDITCPDENKTKMGETVELVNRICSVVTEMKQAFNYSKWENDQADLWETDNGEE